LSKTYLLINRVSPYDPMTREALCRFLTKSQTVN
jgi:hypothetical protein